MSEATQRDTIQFFLDKGILLSPDALAGIDNPHELYAQLSSTIDTGDLVLLTHDIKRLMDSQPIPDTNGKDIERVPVSAQKDQDTSACTRMLVSLETGPGCTSTLDTSVTVSASYTKEPSSIEVQHFVSHFSMRYRSIERFLQCRRELVNLMSISRALQKREREHLSLIGLVMEKQGTKNGNIQLVLEDLTGTVKVIVSKSKPELYELAQDIMLDEVIGVHGVNAERVVFANSIIVPDIPMDTTLKKAPDERYAVFLSDLHVGSTYFLEQEFRRFLDWINCRSGTDEQRAIAEKVGYVFICGDLVDGVGIYPGQEKELVTLDIFKQYEQCGKLLADIPCRIALVICPGNHDAMRLSEPQLPLYKDFSHAIWSLPNVTLVSNPARVTFHQHEGFSGFEVLLYHGYSFDYYAQNVNSIRQGGGYTRPDRIMRYLLQRRHLAPTHTSTLYMPDPDQDTLVIEKAPDFFVTGHIHYSSVSNYRNVTMICGSCFQAKTAFQERMGHTPQPCRVPIVNLKTRNVKILRFGD